MNPATLRKDKTASIRLLALLTALIVQVPAQVLAASERDSNPYAYSKNSTRKIPKQIPDLWWQPVTNAHPFGTSIRYIDFENGSDDNPGTRASPWKHHPWDRNAGGIALRSDGIDTYIFKQGVIYRGSLVARESGTTNTPIRLTVDPGWGHGDAVIAASVAINGGWERCNRREEARLPEASRGKAWCATLHSPEAPGLLWEVHNEGINRIPVARHPNWGISNPDDPRSEWFELEHVLLEAKISLDNTDQYSVGDLIRPVNRSEKQKGGNYRVIGIERKSILIESDNWTKNELKKGILITNGHAKSNISDIWGTHEINRRLQLPEELKNSSPDYYKGAVIWAEGTNIPKSYSARVTTYNPEENSIKANFHLSAGTGPTRHNRYFLEGLPQFLDAPGEYYYKKLPGQAWRLYLRLPDDRNPNHSRIEAAVNPSILEVSNKHDLEISGLHFALSNQIDVDSANLLFAPLHAAAIQIKGSSSNINIHHCHFHHLAAGIIAFPSEKREKHIMDNITITDNEFQDIDGSAIALSNGRHHFSARKTGSRLLHASVLRNRLEHIGYRTVGHWAAGSHGHGIEVTGGEVVEVAGNHVNNVWGSGIALYLGTDYENGMIERPFLHGQIHHNKVTNSVLGLQDYGGIAVWQGGPAYIFNNISGNPVGYKYEHDRRTAMRHWHRRSSFGLGIYLDGQYKSYVFNNIAWGTGNDISKSIYSAGAFKEAMGFMHSIFNNTFYRFAVGLEKDMPQHNRNYYIGNLLVDMGHRQILQNLNPRIIEYDTLAYSRNVFTHTPPVFGQLGHGGGRFTHATLDAWLQDMQRNSVLAADTGIETSGEPIANGDNLDFRLLPDSPAIDAGARVFAPAPLYRVAGEWNFYGSRHRPDRIFGENINMNQEWVHRSMFQDIPRNDLNCHNIAYSDYEYGMLETWIAGALRFNGVDQYCELQDSKLKSGYPYRIRSGILGKIPAAGRDTVDITNGNFLIEAVIAPAPGNTGGGIVSKAGYSGYNLSLTGTGSIKLTLDIAGKRYSRSSLESIDDGKWHHIVAEVDRSAPQGINLYLDGKLSNGHWAGEPSISKESLSSTADFLVGFDGDKHYSGQIDYLRISKGTLYDAETTIEDLYRWQLNGPFLKDFSGNGISGNSRDAGAVEYH